MHCTDIYCIVYTLNVNFLRSASTSIVHNKRKQEVGRGTIISLGYVIGLTFVQRFCRCVNNVFVPSSAVPLELSDDHRVALKNKSENNHSALMDAANTILARLKRQLYYKDRYVNLINHESFITCGGGGKRGPLLLRFCCYIY